ELTSNYIVFTLNSGKPWPEIIVPTAQRQQWLAARTHPIYLLAKKDRLTELKDIALAHGTEVVALNADYFAALLPTPAGK
ncbi:MAG: glycosyltransferase family 39 protein, partial [Methylococcaceae bacterium]